MTKPHLPENIIQELKRLREEMQNLESIATKVEPDEHDIPEIDGLDIYGKSIELNGPIGGDHIIFIDYKKRFDLKKIEDMIKSSNEFRDEYKKLLLEKLPLNYNRAGIFIGDVQGHSATDSIVHAAIHQEFLVLVERELTRYAEVTSRIMDNINDRTFASTSMEKPVTAIFGEMSNQGVLRYIHAGHEEPYTFSNEKNIIAKVPAHLIRHGDPLGLYPTTGSFTKPNGKFILQYKKPYEVSEMKLLSPNDILILYTDGFSDHNKFSREELRLMEEKGEKPLEENYNYIKEKLQNTLIKVKNLPSREIYNIIKDEIMNYGPREDDISFIIVKRTK